MRVVYSVPNNWNAGRLDTDDVVQETGEEVAGLTRAGVSVHGAPSRAYKMNRAARSMCLGPEWERRRLRGRTYVS
jgi:hypothetical protein